MSTRTRSSAPRRWSVSEPASWGSLSELTRWWTLPKSTSWRSRSHMPRWRRRPHMRSWRCRSRKVSRWRRWLSKMWRWRRWGNRSIIPVPVRIIVSSSNIVTTGRCYYETHRYQYANKLPHRVTSYG